MIEPASGNLHNQNVVRFAKAALVTAFFALLWLPIGDSIFRWDSSAPVNENRFAAPFPRLDLPSSPDAVKNFTVGFEQYFNDHFGFRPRLISWSQMWKRRWFQQTWESHVMFGREGWLFGTWSSDPLEEHKAVTTPFSPEALRDWKALFESRRDWLKQRGISYVVIIPPDKQTAYPENLPEGMPSLGSAAKLEQFMGFMKTQTDVEILNLLPALQVARKVNRTFHKTDSHWNEYGAFVADNELIGALSNQISSIRPIPLEAFEQRTVDGTSGNLAWMLTGRNNFAEPGCLTLLPGPSLPKLSRRSRDAGGAGFINPQAQGKAIVFGDSFTDALLPFLAYNFHEVTYYRLYDQRDGPGVNGNEVLHAHSWNRDLIEREKPTVVIDEILNSLLYIEDPAQIKREDHLD